MIGVVLSLPRRGRDLSPFFCAMINTERLLWDGDVAVAVEKPAGLATEAAPSLDSLQLRLRMTLGARTGYLAMAHRLDRCVSGVVLAALTKRAARLLSDQFASRKVEKIYIAILQGRLEVGPTAAGGSSAARWVDTLVKVPGEPRVQVSRDPLRGQRAETEVEVIRYDPLADHTLVRLRPITGRMHQLRVQSAARGYPILGDPFYGGAPGPSSAGRIALHAASLRFHDPRNGVRVQVACPPPDPADWLS